MAKNRRPIKKLSPKANESSPVNVGENTDTLSTPGKKAFPKKILKRRTIGKSAKSAGTAPKKQVAAPPGPIQPLPDKTQAGEQRQAAKKQKIAASLQKFKTGKPKPEKKAKGRVYRSLRERSRLPALIGLGILLLAVVILLWGQIGTRARLVSNLSRFQIPAQINGFYPKSDPYLSEAINAGPAIVPVLLAKYSKMDRAQKVATMVLLQEFKGQEDTGVMPVLIDAMLSGDEILAGFACIAAGQRGYPAIEPLLTKLASVEPGQKKYLIRALGRTRKTEALTVLIKLTEDSKLVVRREAVYALRYFPDQQKAIDRLFLTLRSSEVEVADQALEVFTDIFNQGRLNKYATQLSDNLKNLFANTADPQLRARLITMMGVVGLCLRDNGQNYSNIFVDSVRRAFRKGTIAEKIAAATTAGKFRDNQLLDDLLGALDSDTPQLTKAVAEALIALDNYQAPQLLLKKNFSSRAQVLAAVAKILLSYQIYVRRLELQEKAVSTLHKMMTVSPAASMQTLAEVLGFYQGQAIASLLFVADDFAKPGDLLAVLINHQQPLAQYLYQHFSKPQQDILQRSATITPLPKELSTALATGFNQVLAEISLYRQENFSGIKLSPATKLWMEQRPQRLVHHNRLLLQDAYPQLLRRSQLLDAADLINASALILRLRTPSRPASQATPKQNPEEKKNHGKTPAIVIQDTRNPLSRHIWHQLSPETQKLLHQYDQKQQVPATTRDRLVDEINLLLAKGPLYEEYLFKDIALSPQILKWVKQQPQGRERIHLNRALLQQAYPKLIAGNQQLAPAQAKPQEKTPKKR